MIDHLILLKEHTELKDKFDQQAKEIAELRAANLAISETHHRLSFDAREAEARRADVEAERDRLRAEVERLTDAMSWSEAKAHEDAANLRIEVARLQENCQSVERPTNSICMNIDKIKAAIRAEAKPGESIQMLSRTALALVDSHDRLQKERDEAMAELGMFKMGFEQNPSLRAALLHVLARYDGDEYREVLSGFAARLREQG